MVLTALYSGHMMPRTDGKQVDESASWKQVALFSLIEYKICRESANLEPHNNDQNFHRQILMMVPVREFEFGKVHNTAIFLAVS
jgi:hypothetical protein